MSAHKHGCVGTVIRAYRTGYRYSEKHKAWIRICNVDTGFRIELQPPTRIDTKLTYGSTHVAWWEGEDGGVKLLDMISSLRQVRRCNKPIAFAVNEIGELIK